MPALVKESLQSDAGENLQLSSRPSFVSSKSSSNKLAAWRKGRVK